MNDGAVLCTYPSVECVVPTSAAFVANIPTLRQPSWISKDRPYPITPLRVYTTDHFWFGAPVFLRFDCRQYLRYNLDKAF